ncbi:MAG: DUF1295 domain-containing protein [Lysobacterales bacterium]
MIGIVAIAAASVMTLAWLRQLRTHNAGWVDVIWASMTGAAAIGYGVGGNGAFEPRLLTALLGGLWGLRLASHLARRLYGEPEDSRYASMRERTNGDQRGFIVMYAVQATLVVVCSLPFFASASNPVAGLTAWAIAAIVVWIVAVGGETIADSQLARFRSAPMNRGRVCDVGLWKYSRHPNYFFEWLHWFTYALLAIGSPIQWLAWLGPVLMFLLVYFVSGVPFAERASLRSRGDAYRDYQSRVSKFFPLPPKTTGP